ncbi:DNA recombination protein [Sesbania bispinosa]|nr:DNA recombination protein [Sesbania bispinosa]
MLRRLLMPIARVIRRPLSLVLSRFPRWLIRDRSLLFRQPKKRFPLPEPRKEKGKDLGKSVLGGVFGRGPQPYCFRTPSLTILMPMPSPWMRAEGVQNCVRKERDKLVVQLGQAGKAQQDAEAEAKETEEGLGEDAQAEVGTLKSNHKSELEKLKSDHATAVKEGSELKQKLEAAESARAICWGETLGLLENTLILPLSK